MKNHFIGTNRAKKSKETFLPTKNTVVYTADAYTVTLEFYKWIGPTKKLNREHDQAVMIPNVLTGNKMLSELNLQI